MAPHEAVYLDYYQSEDRENEPLAIGGYIPIQRVYHFEPIPKELTEEEGKRSSVHR